MTTHSLSLSVYSRTSASRRWEYTNFCANMIPLENELHEMQIVIKPISHYVMYYCLLE